MMKNAFYFTLKALFVINIFKFLSWLFSDVEKRLDQKHKTNFKILKSKPGKEEIAIHILPYVSRSKDNQAIKFDLLKVH